MKELGLLICLAEALGRSRSVKSEHPHSKEVCTPRLGPCSLTWALHNSQGIAKTAKFSLGTILFYKQRVFFCRHTDLFVAILNLSSKRRKR